MKCPWDENLFDVDWRKSMCDYPYSCFEYALLNGCPIGRSHLELFEDHLCIDTVNLNVIEDL